MNTFDYRTWALECASETLTNSVDAGLEIADGAPDPEKARAAVRNVAKDLKDQASNRRRAFNGTGNSP